MDMKKYMTFEAEHKRLLSIDENTHMMMFDSPRMIRCFKYGKDIFLREKTAATTVSAQVYLTLEKVVPGDLLDGQVVKSINVYPENWTSKECLYEVLTWND